MKFFFALFLILQLVRGEDVIKTLDPKLLPSFLQYYLWECRYLMAQDGTLDAVMKVTKIKTKPNTFRFQCGDDNVTVLDIILAGVKAGYTGNGGLHNFGIPHSQYSWSSNDYRADSKLFCEYWRENCNDALKGQKFRNVCIVSGKKQLFIQYAVCATIGSRVDYSPDLMSLISDNY